MTSSAPVLGSFPQAVQPCLGGGWQLNSIKAHAHLLLNSVGSIALFRAGAAIPALKSMRALWAAPSLLLSPLDEGTPTQNRKSSFGHTTPLDTQPTHRPTRGVTLTKLNPTDGFYKVSFSGGQLSLTQGLQELHHYSSDFLDDVSMPMTCMPPSLAAPGASPHCCSHSSGTLPGENSCVSRGNQGSPHAPNPTATPSL